MGCLPRAVWQAVCEQQRGRPRGVVSKREEGHWTGWEKRSQPGWLSLVVKLLSFPPSAFLFLLIFFLLFLPLFFFFRPSSPLLPPLSLAPLPPPSSSSPTPSPVPAPGILSHCSFPLPSMPFLTSLACADAVSDLQNAAGEQK